MSSRRPLGRDEVDDVTKALNHRVRVAILTALHDGPASQKDLATLLHQPLSNISHHIEELRKSAAIEVAYTKRVGNVDQHYYAPVIVTATYRHPEELATLTEDEHQVLSRVIVQSISAEVLAALRAGHLAGDPHASTAWDRVWLDERGYRELAEAAGAFLVRMEEIAAESTARIAETGEPASPYIGAVMAFRQAPSPTTGEVRSSIGEDAG
jgi:DNA-binding transcriptional ArsR family regulator